MNKDLNSNDTILAMNVDDNIIMASMLELLIKKKVFTITEFTELLKEKQNKK